MITTTRLDRLAAEGLRFTDAYSTAAVCAPSRGSLLTGLHTGHSTVRANPSSGGQSSLTDVDTTFAEVLRARGYRTAVIGKWGFGPEAAGQDSHPAARVSRSSTATSTTVTRISTTPRTSGTTTSRNPSPPTPVA